MALVSTGFEVNVSLKDTAGDVSTLAFALVAAVYADAVAAATTIITELADVTDSVVAGYRVTEVFAEDALALPAAAENSVKASITLNLDATPAKAANIQIPAPSVGIFTSATGGGYNVVDVSDLDLNAYVDLFKTTGGVATISDGETVDDTTPIQSGKRISVNSRRG